MLSSKLLKISTLEILPQRLYSQRKTSCSQMIKMTESKERNQSAPTSRNSSGDRMRNNNQEFRHGLYEFTDNEMEKELHFWTNLKVEMVHLNSMENQETEVRDETHEGVMGEPVLNPMRTEPPVSIQAETLGVNKDPKETIYVQLNGEEGTLTPTGTEGEYLWTNRNGASKGIKIPCAYHLERQVPAAFCFADAREHCLECSSPVKLAEPVETCLGNHQWEPEAREKAKKQ